MVLQNPYDGYPLPSPPNEYHLKADDVGELDNLDDEDIAEDAEEDADDKDDETAGDEGMDDGYRLVMCSPRIKCEIPFRIAAGAHATVFPLS
jgi:hypothetical protein